MNYLVDTSALVRILRRQVDESWHEQVTHGMVAICDPVLTEALAIARTSEYKRVRADLLEIYPWVPVPDRAWETISSVQAQLAAKSQHQGLSVADHLVVATALHHHLSSTPSGSSGSWRAPPRSAARGRTVAVAIDFTPAARARWSST